MSVVLDPITTLDSELGTPANARLVGVIDPWGVVPIPMSMAKGPGDATWRVQGGPLLVRLEHIELCLGLDIVRCLTMPAVYVCGGDNLHVTWGPYVKNFVSWEEI